MTRASILPISLPSQVAQAQRTSPRQWGTAASLRIAKHRLSISTHASLGTTAYSYRSGRSLIDEFVLEHQVNSSVTSHYYIRKWGTLWRSPPAQDEVEAAVIEDLNSKETDRLLTVLGGLVRMANSMSPNSLVLFKLLRQVDDAADGIIFRTWLERDFLDRSELQKAELNDLTLKIADTILGASFGERELSNEEVSEWEQLQGHARASKEIILNPSVAVGRIDGGRSLYAPRRCRMTEVVREYCHRSLLEQACRVPAILTLTRLLPGDTAEPFTTVGALMVLNGCLVSLPETSAALADAAVEDGLIRHLVHLLEDSRLVLVENKAQGDRWNTPVNRPAAVLLFRLLASFPHVINREGDLLLAQGVPKLLRLAQYGGVYRDSQGQWTRYASLNCLRLICKHLDQQLVMTTLVEERAAEIMTKQMQEFEPLPNDVLPGCEPHCSLAILSQMARHDPSTRKDLLSRLPHFCSLLGTRQSEFLQERVLEVLKALAEVHEEEVWKSLDAAHHNRSFQHAHDVDPAKWQQWWSRVVTYLA
eukprot:jgi/Botrbrau1/1011/Bobra.114_1s0049.1